MALSLEDVKRQKDGLLTKHPELAGYSCCRIADTDMDLDTLASFMWRCWSHDYPEGLTIVSEPSIKWNLGNGLMDENSSLAVYDGETLCGVVLGYRRTLILRDQKVSSVINTGFSVPKEYRGKGICQFLRLNYMEANLGTGLPITFGWYDTRHNKPGTAYSIYAHKNSGGGMLHVDIPLFGKSLDYDITRRYERVGLIEGAILKLSTALFSPGNRMSHSFQLGCFQDKEVKNYLELIRDTLRDRPMRRHFDANSLTWHLNFSKGHFKTICFTLKDDERIAGIVYGFKNRVGDHFVAFLDGLILAPNLSYGQKRRFIGSVEERLRDDNCFAVTGVKTVFSENPLKYGYVPFSKQTMEIAINDDRSSVSKHEVLNSFFELR